MQTRGRSSRCSPGRAQTARPAPGLGSRWSRSSPRCTAAASGSRTATAAGPRSASTCPIVWWSRYRDSGVPRGLVLALALVLAAASATVAHADGDPASDVLPLNSVYFPLTAPSADAQSTLKNAVDGVYASGQRVKVAVIATK